MGNEPEEKQKWSFLRYRKRDLAHNVFVAVQRWIHANKGTAVVMSGIDVQDWHEGEFKYRVALSILGKRPEKSAQESGKGAADGHDRR